MKKSRHELRCIIKHLENTGRSLLKRESEFWKGHGDALLRVVDILKGDISGDTCVIHDCICRVKRVAKYDHYEKKVSNSNKESDI